MTCLNIWRFSPDDTVYVNNNLPCWLDGDGSRTSIKRGHFWLNEALSSNRAYIILKRLSPWLSRIAGKDSAECVRPPDIGLEGKKSLANKMRKQLGPCLPKACRLIPQKPSAQEEEHKGNKEEYEPNDRQSRHAFRGAAQCAWSVSGDHIFHRALRIVPARTITHLRTWKNGPRTSIKRGHFWPNEALKIFRPLNGLLRQYGGELYVSFHCRMHHSTTVAEALTTRPPACRRLSTDYGCRIYDWITIRFLF